MAEVSRRILIMLAIYELVPPRGRGGRYDTSETTGVPNNGRFSDHAERKGKGYINVNY